MLNVAELSMSALIIIVVNILLAITIIFLERRDATSTWAWILVLFFIPLVGFVLYLLLGRPLRKKHLFRWDGRKDIGIDQLIHYQIDAIANDTFEYRNPQVEKYDEMIFMQLRNNDAVLTQDNAVHIFHDGVDKFEQLILDIEQARDHIHIQYYIFKLDQLGQRIYRALLKKAKQGVKVRILYDEMGSRTTKKRHFKQLIAAGGEVEVFFPSILPLINPRMNYRNHRKIVIIDGKTGYIGGFNVGDEYLGLQTRFGYWRDTHLRLQGSAVHPLQTRFILDWNQATTASTIHYANRYFPIIPRKGTVSMQIVSSGPDSSFEQIKNGYLKMISMAKRYIYIQSPYFIPDQSFMDAIRIACLSGIDVRIMIPNKPDHMFVYWATYSYVGQLLEAGAKIFHYDRGFIHAKMIVIDDEVSTVGTANIDLRSFRLNFEVNAFIYDRSVSHHLAELFERDMLDCSELTIERYHARSLTIRMKESISRLLSPIL